MDNWVCYVIVSNTSNQTYVGASNNAVKRLYNHNRGAGAKRTRGQTWAHTFIISGFECKRSCLSFEAGFKRLGKRRVNSRFNEINAKYDLNLKYTRNFVHNRLLDLLYFVRNFSYTQPKFMMWSPNKIRPPQLTLTYNAFEYMLDLPWPKFITLDIHPDILF